LLSSSINNHNARAATIPAPRTAPAALSRFPAPALAVAEAEVDEPAAVVLGAEVLVAEEMLEANDDPILEPAEVVDEALEEDAVDAEVADDNGAGVPVVTLDEPAAAWRVQIWLVTLWTFKVSEVEQAEAMQGVAALVMASLLLPHWHA